MPVYTYRCIDTETQKTITGKIEAETYRDVKAAIRDKGQVPTQIEEERADIDFGGLMQKIPLVGKLLAPKVSTKSLTIFTQQMTTLIEAGIPLIESLFLLEQQTTDARLKELLHKIRADVIAGDSLSNAMSRYPNDFPSLYRNLMKSGEVSGQMDKITIRLSILLEKFMALQQKVISAMVYPCITVVIIIGVMAVIMLFVVPQFQKVFASKGANLPMPTVVLIETSKFTVQFWWAMLLGIVGFAAWFNIFRTTFGKPIVDQWVLTVPVLGGVIRKIYTARFIRTLATVLGSGVPLTEGLSIATNTVDNVIIKVALGSAKESLMMGGTLSKPLEKARIFPVMVTKMIAIGEETGEMEKMLNKSADFLENEVDAGVDTLTTLMEPLMIVILGLIMLGVALALYLPMFQMGEIMAG